MSLHLLKNFQHFTYMHNVFKVTLSHSNLQKVHKTNKISLKTFYIIYTSLIRNYAKMKYTT
jgi:hypothetical protein